MEREDIENVAGDVNLHTIVNLTLFCLFSSHIFYVLLI